MKSNVMARKNNSKIGKKKEIRVAVVFYGGVTLAIYENGVAQSFFDLTHKQHVFKLVLEMLDADAVIDVMSGASAGGINSLLLASALEHGTNIKTTNKLWRELADFGELIFKPTEDRPDSLLDKNNAFLNRLIIGFENLADEQNKQSSEFDPIKNEIDLFITGTDLHGRIYRYIDQIGSIIDDKDHRTVFHLKYRPGTNASKPRKRVGITTDFLDKNKSDDDKLNEVQATTLASIARITSSFPGAFPPYSVDKIGNKALRKDVKDALQYFADIKKSEVRDGNRFYVDGGTLNNKPFEPVLKSIFYRMPANRVERKLFYVEPNPEEPTKESLFGTEKEESPLKVLFSTGSSIPLSQSIRDNLEDLKSHNSKVEWLGAFRKTAKSSLNKKKIIINNDVAKIYLNTRIESTAKSILLRSTNPPKAQDSVMELGEENGMINNDLKIENYLLDLFQIVIKEKLASDISGEKIEFLKQARIKINEIGNLKNDAEDQLAKNDILLMIEKFNCFDVNYIQRKCFYNLYEIYDEIYTEMNKNYSEKDIIRLEEILFITGRLIKLVKIIRVSFVKLRDKIIKDAVKDSNNESGFDRDIVRSIVGIFVDFLKVPGIEYWHGNDLWDTKTVKSLQDIKDKNDHNWDDLCKILSEGLSSENLNELNAKIDDIISRCEFDDILKNKKTLGSNGGDDITVLCIIETVLEYIVIGQNSPIISKHNYKNFTYVDSLVFPQEYLSGIFEKDKIEYVRISPRDAKLGLSDLPPSSKIAGDDLGSFGGFMRRDWRSNDILWGRLDSICLIIQTLLTDETIKDILENQNLVYL